MIGTRICIMTETYHPVTGGGETQARTLARGLAQRGVSVLVLTRRTSPDLPREEWLDGARVWRLPPTGPSRRKKWGLVLSGFWALFRHRHEYDAVLVCGFRILGIPAVLAAKILDKVCILKADSLGEMSGDFFSAGLRETGLAQDSFPFSLFLVARNRLFHGADRFVAISRTIVRELQETGVEPTKVRAIPNSVDVRCFRPVTEVEKTRLREDLGLPRDRMITSFTGRLVSYKGLPLLLRVWADLAEERDPGLLLLVGSGGLDMHSCEDQLREFVRDHRLEENVAFVGEVDAVGTYLQASDLFVFPSENEAFGISVIEAMATGLPVVSSDAGGLRDIVEDRRTGLSFPSGEGGGLKDCLSRLLDDPELRRSLGEAARTSVVAEYSDERVVGEYADLLEAEIGRKTIH